MRKYDVDQRELAWGTHLYEDDHTHFPTRGTCLEQVDDPSQMARQYFSDSNPPQFRPDKTFVDLATQSCLNSWMGGNVAARPLDVARFVYQTYSPHGKLLKHSSQAMMVDYHPLTQGFAAGFLTYGLGSIGFGGPSNVSFCDGLHGVGHPGQDFGSGAPFNWYIPELDIAINIAMTSSFVLLA